MNPFQTFGELNLPSSLSKALDQMQFINPTEIQAASIPPALEGRDILGTAQTGTGKTGAFGIPLVSKLLTAPDRQALILAPTRELAAQIFTVITQMGKGSNIKGVLIVGGESFGRQRDQIRRGANFIVATPGRLNDHLQERTVSLKSVAILVMDEVDRMLDMGFAPQIRQIGQYLPEDRQTLLFSATLPDEVLRLASTYLKEPVRVAIQIKKEAEPLVEEEIIETTHLAKNNLIIKEIEKREGKILIFARTQSRAERLARIIYDDGFRVVCLHGGRSQSQRKDALAQFRSGQTRILVATDIAGRGIDVDDIEHVINYDPPQSREDYIHRIGRTGRYGKTGKALNFLTSGDLEGENIYRGVKPKSRVVFRSSRYGRRR